MTTFNLNDYAVVDARVSFCGLGGQVVRIQNTAAIRGFYDVQTADGNTYEIGAQFLKPFVCPDCGRPLDTYVQIGTKPYTAATCQTTGCTLQWVTRNPAFWLASSEVERDTYRAMVLKEKRAG